MTTVINENFDAGIPSPMYTTGAVNVVAGAVNCTVDLSSIAPPVLPDWVQNISDLKVPFSLPTEFYARCKMTFTGALPSSYSYWNVFTPWDSSFTTAGPAVRIVSGDPANVIPATWAILWWDGTQVQTAFGPQVELGRTYDVVLRERKGAAGAGLVELYLDGSLAISVTNASAMDWVGGWGTLEVGFQANALSLWDSYRGIETLIFDDLTIADTNPVPPPGYGSLFVTADVPASLTVNGSSGTAPFTFTLAAGNYNVTATYQNMPAQTKSATVTEGQTTTLQFQFAGGAPTWVIVPVVAIILTYMGTR